MAVPHSFSDLVQATLGDKILYVSLLLGLALIALLLYDQIKNTEQYNKHIKWGVRAFGALLLTDYLLLVYYFIVNDFTYNYVWTFSDRNLSIYYRISAALAGQEGTFLFWAAIIGAGAMWLNEKKESTSDFIKKTQIVVLLIGVFFIFLTIKQTPFATIHQLFPELPAGFIPADGNGLNPLLIDPWMAVHPLVMFIGYAAVTNPFAISLVYLYMSIRGRAGEIEKIGIENVVQFCRVAWFFLTFAIAIGGFWAYKVLGWGGFWAWDPVETASLIPWLMLTAAMHTLVEHKKDRHKYAILAPVLVGLSYSLVVYATLVTRSGFFESVHAFAAGTTGSYLVAMTLISTVVVVALGALRYAAVSDDHKPESQDSSFVNKTNIFYITILFLVVLTYISIWGITYPALLKLLAGRKVGTGIAFFNLWSYPFFMGLFLLAGLCLNYKPSNKEKSVREFKIFFALTLVAALIRPSDAWNIVDYSAVVNAQSPLLYRFIGGASALSFIPPMVYIVYSLSNRYNDRIKNSKNRNFTLKEIGILSIHLGIVFIVLGGVFATMFSTEFAGSANIKNNEVSSIEGMPYGLSVVDYRTVVDYGSSQDVGVVEQPVLPGISLAEMYAELRAGEFRETYSVRGEIVESLQTEHITYVHIKEDDLDLWVAIDKMDNVPNNVNVVADGMLMADFPSPTLNRTFDLILFANQMEEYSAQTGKKPYTTTEEITFAVYEKGSKIGQGVARSIDYNNGNANRVMIDRGVLRDVYVIYNGLTGDSASATVKIIPLINELWFGVLLFMAGILLVFIFDPAYHGRG
ncbi:cytochrome c-type biogenesis protein CcmF [archaeon BMS3Abin16]|nr:cytochrome c-type biogenesis protein CcmF [archaeon BMS3Abin16]